MSGFTPWRRGAAPAQDEPAGSGDQLERLRADLRKARNERAALISQLRDTVRDRDRKAEQLRACNLMLDGALKHSEDTCAHAGIVRDQRVQLEAMQRRLDELQAANENHDRAAYRRFAMVPPQRRG